MKRKAPPPPPKTKPRKKARPTRRAVPLLPCTSNVTHLDPRTMLCQRGWLAPEPLYGHQNDALRWFVHNPQGFMVAWPMGAGKTRTAAGCGLLHAFPPSAPDGRPAGLDGRATAWFLIIAPLSLQEQWRTAMEDEAGVPTYCTHARRSFKTRKYGKWRKATVEEGEAPVAALIMTPDALRTWCKGQPNMDAVDDPTAPATIHGGADGARLFLGMHGIHARDMAYLVVDEAHLYRNMGTKKRKALSHLLSAVRGGQNRLTTLPRPLRVLFITGTPNFRDHKSNLSSLYALARGRLQAVARGTTTEEGEAAAYDTSSDQEGEEEEEGEDEDPGAGAGAGDVVDVDEVDLDEDDIMEHKLNFTLRNAPPGSVHSISLEDIADLLNFKVDIQEAEVPLSLTESAKARRYAEIYVKTALALNRAYETRNWPVARMLERRLSIIKARYVTMLSHGDLMRLMIDACILAVDGGLAEAEAACGGAGAAEEEDPGAGAGAGEVAEPVANAPRGGLTSVQECPVCFEDAYCVILRPFSAGSSCPHAFCWECTKTWFAEATTCPTCRRDIRADRIPGLARRDAPVAAASSSDDDEPVPDAVPPPAPFRLADLSLNDMRLASARFIQHTWDAHLGALPPTGPMPARTVMADLLKAVLPKIGATVEVCLRRPLRRLVVFCGRLATIATIDAALRFIGVPSEVFVGSMSAKDRQAALANWRAFGPTTTSTPTVLLMTYEAGGVGLNLHDGDAVVHVDPPTTLLLQQAQCRVQRPPRTTPVHVTFVQATMFDGGHTLDHAIRDIAEARFRADAATMLKYMSGRLDAARSDAVAAAGLTQSQAEVAADAAGAGDDPSTGATSANKVSAVGSLCFYIQTHHRIGSFL